MKKEKEKPRSSLSLSKHDMEGENTRCPSKMADHQNKFFRTMDTTEKMLAESIPTPQSALLYTEHQKDINFENFHMTNNTEVSNIIDSLKPKTSAGKVDISSMVKRSPIVNITNKPFS